MNNFLSGENLWQRFCCLEAWYLQVVHGAIQCDREEEANCRAVGVDCGCGYLVFTQNLLRKVNRKSRGNKNIFSRQKRVQQIKQRV